MRSSTPYHYRIYFPHCITRRPKVYSQLRLLLHQSLQCHPHPFRYPLRSRSSPLTLDIDMHKLSNSLYFFHALLEDGSLVRDTAFPELLHTHPDIQNGGEGDGTEIVAMRVYDEADLRGCRRVEFAVRHEICVDDGVEAALGVGRYSICSQAGGLENMEGGLQVVVYGVVDVVIHIVVHPV